MQVFGRGDLRGGATRTTQKLRQIVLAFALCYSVNNDSTAVTESRKQNQKHNRK
jgi:hypothetical protein